MSIAQRVESFLKSQSVPYEILRHRPTSTSLRSARVAHLKPDCMVKAVVVEDNQGAMLTMLPATRQLKLGKLSRVTGRDLRLCSEAEIGHLFPDCVTGAVPPLPAAYGMEAVWDDSLMRQDELYFEAGDHMHLVHMKRKDFINMLRGAAHEAISREG